ncbi:T9SS type A sorting domain-containing protein [Aequorivita sp. CIP111184]|uniref:T9SS type A sorting domain-containing protein n=1 Tax=Aequorivita sp. CIP111184 TaxID=2211356 RepID=UPI000DBC23CB|nr:T9SS type A sorting domain-containing protein [Aequorivita sp. CIP111184]SRX52625.1 Internalin-J [Aequorivita sp. CIP111184]
MKIYYIITLFLLSSIAQAQIVNIPDANFKNALLNHSPIIDTNGDGEIQVTEAEATLIITIEHKGIQSLNGIQSFVNLEDLNCHDNSLTVLDISQNQNLKKLRCSWNQLTNLDISQNLNLELLVCYHNELTNIDVTQHPNLEELWVSINPLTSLDVTHNSSLKKLHCDSTQLTSLDVSQNSNLEGLSFKDTQFSNIDVTQNFKLRYITFSNANLTHLDLSQNPNLIALDCYNNQLIYLNIKNGNNINMPYMDAENNPNLQCIKVDNVVNANNRQCYRGDPMVGWCKDATASFSEECVLGIDEQNLATFDLFPNPAKDILIIKAKETPELIQIYTTTGMLIRTTSNTTLDISDLASGLYFLSASIQGKSITKKFIKS